MTTRVRTRPTRVGAHPAQFIVGGFAGVIVLGTALLALPISREGSDKASLLDAAFTATSAVCVTGLVTVDTASYWSGFGEAVILLLIQVGGLGIMTMASLAGLVVFRRLGLRSRLRAAAESKAQTFGSLREIVSGVLIISLIAELATTAVLTARFYYGYDESFWQALRLGGFHAISAFNNAGFALYSDSLTRFVSDAAICLPIAVAVIVGGVGFPVLFELRRNISPRHWSLHTKLTLMMTAVLLTAGTVSFMFTEWTNAATLGALDVPDRLLASFFQGGVMPRTAGFNSLDVAAMDEATWLSTSVLMFIGGGSAGTAGGIKVTTFVILFFAIVAEVRGERSTRAFDRRIEGRVQRQALSVALLSVAAIVTSTLILMEMTRFTMGQVLFEVVSAFGTVGMSTGITAQLPPAGQILLIGLMFLGRLGPITLVSALALRDRPRLYELPEGRPIIG